MKLLRVLLSAAVASVLPAVAADESESGSWMIDFEAAKKKAADEKKDLLMDFTGSDWCGWCIRLKKEVFDQDAFKQKVGDHFILVELDYPRDKSKLAPETIAQNEMLGEKYAIEGYPTIILADSAGRPSASGEARVPAPPSSPLRCGVPRRFPHRWSSRTA